MHRHLYSSVCPQLIDRVSVAMCDCQGSVLSNLAISALSPSSFPSIFFVLFLLSPDDSHTLQQTLSLFRAARGLIAQSAKPLVDWRSVMPSIVSWWNKVKRPVHSTSQYLATLIRDSIQDSPCEFAMVERLLQLLALPLFKFSNIIDIHSVHLTQESTKVQSLHEATQ